MGEIMDILMMDGCTRREAEKYLRNGTRVFDGVQEYAENLEADGIAVPEDLENMIMSGRCADVHDVDGYVIEYVM